MPELLLIPFDHGRRVPATLSIPTPSLHPRQSRGILCIRNSSAQRDPTSPGQSYEAHQKLGTLRLDTRNRGNSIRRVPMRQGTAGVGQQGGRTDPTAFLLEVYRSKGKDEGSIGAPFRSPFGLFTRSNCFFEGVLSLTLGRFTQLIALTGKSGAWRKTTID